MPTNNNVKVVKVKVVKTSCIINITAAGAVDRELLYIELGDLFPPQHQQQQQQRTTTTINNNTNNQQQHQQQHQQSTTTPTID